MITTIPITNLEPHPDNPRLIIREDVISGILAQIQETGEFDPAHALLVRPLNGHYQIIRGHHRYEAAKRAGFDSVPCWVREMDDDDAYMQLALGNVQGELSPLEIGIHALRGVEVGKRGRGNDGDGLKNYANQLGKAVGYISELRQAAIVMQYTKIFSQENILDKAKHLAAIHKAPESVWQLLVEWLITPKDPDKPDSTPSVNQTADIVKEVSKFSIPERWQEVFLPLPNIIGSYLKTKNPTPITVSDLVTEVENTERIIKSSQDMHGESFPYQVDEFHAWLKNGMGLLSWDVNEIRKYQLNVIEAARAAALPPEADPQLGEWWELGRHLLYCGDTGQAEFWQTLPKVTFAFADPPYNAEVAEWDIDFKWSHDWLIQKAGVVAVTPGISSIDSFFREDTQMPYVWSISTWIKNGMTRGALGYGNWIYTAIFSELDSLNTQQQDCLEVNIKTSQTKNSNHKGRKPPEFIEHLVKMFTKQGDTVIDPFLGSGTTLLIAEKLGRACIGGELRLDFCKGIITQWQDATGQIAKRMTGNADSV